MLRLRVRHEQVSDLYSPKEQWASYVINAIKAKELQIRDVNYIVRGNEVRLEPYSKNMRSDGTSIGAVVILLQSRSQSALHGNAQVILVDEFTGRTMPGRRWSEGLHQAVEAKEGLPIQNETITLASISYQVLVHAPHTCDLRPTQTWVAADRSHCRRKLLSKKETVRQMLYRL